MGNALHNTLIVEENIRDEVTKKMSNRVIEFDFLTTPTYDKLRIRKATQLLYGDDIKPLGPDELPNPEAELKPTLLELAKNSDWWVEHGATICDCIVVPTHVEKE